VGEVIMAKPILSGAGVLTFLGFSGDVGYELHGSPKLDRIGGSAGRGWIDTSAEDARAAFRAGRATLQLEDRRDVRVTMTAHSNGSGRAYFDVTG
jgi:hypothetical protein